MRNPIDVWKDVWFEIRSAYQRGRYGFAHRDAWNFNQACAQWSLPRLRHLRANLNGHPCDLAEHEWEAILDEIIFALGECATGAEMDRIFDRYPYPDFRFVDCGAYSRMERVGDDPHRETRDAERKALDDRVEAGLVLFGRWYQSLWD